MKFRIISITLLLLTSRLFSQFGVIQNDNYKHGPCLNYLNILQYDYSFADLKKDTLKYPAGDKPGAVFVQNKGNLLNAVFYDRKNKIISAGTFKDGNGKLIVDYGPNYHYVFNFSNGRLNDTSIQIANGRTTRKFIYKDNILIKQEWTHFNRIVANYDENGLANDSTFFYGRPKRPMFNFISKRPDLYRGKLYQVNIYDHGHLTEEIFYEKDGSVKQKNAITRRSENYSTKVNKNCL